MLHAVSKLQPQGLVENPNVKINEDIIQNIRKEEDIVEYLIDVCKALETIGYYKYTGYKVIDDENQFKKVKDWIPIKDTRMSLVEFYFTVTYKDEVRKETLQLFIPKLINNYYFIIDGNRQYAIYQNVDSATYNTKDSIILKSLLMPIVLRRMSKKLVDIDKNEYVDNIYQINLFKHRINILHYYFATKGFTETLKFFGFSKSIKVVGNAATSNTDKTLFFPITKTESLMVSAKKFKENKTYRNIVFCILDVFNKRTDFTRLEDPEYWKIKLGAIFTKNTHNQLEKAETVLLSFNRILDNRTKKNLRIAEKDKEDIFAIIRYMVRNFSELMRQDNLSLLNKRIRLGEYLMNAFNLKMSTNTYRILYKKNKNIQTLCNTFKVNPMLIINDIKTSDLLRISNAVNDMDLFNCALKYSNRGPASLGDGSGKTIPAIYRTIHISHLGRKSINSVSSSDPGMSGCLSPFIQTDGFYYDTSKLVEEEENDGE